MESVALSEHQYNSLNHARIDLTISEIDHLRNRVDEWFRQWNDRDERGQFKTQLDSLECLIHEALSGLRTQAGNLNASSPKGLLYSECRSVERRLLWIERALWGYFREKFDQRLDPHFKDVLAAADEVVWSCYAEAFSRAALSRKTSPLAYIEPHFTPKAIPRDDPPGEIRDSQLGGVFLETFLREMPFPLVSIPPMCVQAPWFLIYLAHEVGHHVQFDLLPDLGLVTHFGDLVYKEAASVGITNKVPTQADNWKKWSQEIFADIYSVCMMGSSAAWAMAELETAAPEAMTQSSSHYPAPLVRIKLLQTAVGALSPEQHLNPSLPEVAGPDPLPEDTRADLNLAPDITRGLLSASLTNGITLPTLADWDQRDHNAHGERAMWRRVLAADNIPLSQPRRTRRSIRLITSAALANYVALSSEKDGALRNSAQRLLSKRMLQSIAQNKEEGTRSANKTTVTPVKPIAEDLTRTLLQADLFV